MPADAPSSLYEQLADKYHAKGKFPERDRFLILAADAAWNAGQPDTAEGLRRRILEHNPNHLLRPYASFAEALKSADILAYVQQLRRGYPRERALELLKELDQDPRLKRKSEADFGLGEASPAKSPAAPAPFKLADDAKKLKAEPKTAAPRPQMPPQLTQSQSLQGEAAKAGRQAPAAQPSWQPARPSGGAGSPAALALGAEPTPGSAVGSFLFLVVLAAALGTAAYVLVWPFVEKL